MQLTLEQYGEGAVRGVNPLLSQKSTYNFRLPKKLIAYCKPKVLLVI